jgi:hypothetical protein
LLPVVTHGRHGRCQPVVPNHHPFVRGLQTGVNDGTDIGTDRLLLLSYFPPGRCGFLAVSATAIRGIKRRS